MRTFKSLISLLPKDAALDLGFKALDEALSKDGSGELKAEMKNPNSDRIISLLRTRLHNKKDITLAYTWIKSNQSNE